MGFEPTTPTLARLCSTPELRPRPERRNTGTHPPAQARSVPSADVDAPLAEPAIAQHLMTK